MSPAEIYVFFFKDFTIAKALRSKSSMIVRIDKLITTQAGQDP